MVFSMSLFICCRMLWVVLNAVGLLLMRMVRCLLCAPIVFLLIGVLRTCILCGVVCFVSSVVVFGAIVECMVTM